MQEYNFTELQTITRLAGLGSENHRYCYFCGAQRLRDTDGSASWYGGEDDCPHAADLNEDDG
jgi:hypothetical protein